MTKEGQIDGEFPPLGKAVRRQRPTSVTPESGHNVSQPMIEKLCEIARTIECVSIGSRAWDHLSKPQRDRLTAMASKICRPQSPLEIEEPIKPITPFELCYQYLHRSFGMWMWAHNVNQWEAIISLARKLGRLSADDAQDLWKQVSSRSVADMPGFVAKPVWTKASRQLWFNNDVLRTITSDKPTKIEPVLDTFEAAGWPSAIQWPPQDQGKGAAVAESTSGRLSDLVRSLNDVTHIRFAAHGKMIHWAPVL